MIGATNHTLEVTREKNQKKEQIIKKQKIEIIATKHSKARRGISLFSEEEEDYKSNTGEEINLDQADNKYLLQP